MESKNILATLGLAALFAARSASALPTITVDSVVQRWPWNNKVDITYTISGGQNVKAGDYQRVMFTASVGGTTYTIDGSRDIIASANTGTHTVTWEPPSGLKASDCTMTASLYSTSADYMIVDLDTGAYAFEELRATQAESNARYNTKTDGVCKYKDQWLVLRKVGKAAENGYPGGYPIGDDVNFSTSNGATNWVTDADYFIGVFEVTQAQYVRLGLAVPDGQDQLVPGDISGYRPVCQLAVHVLRGKNAAGKDNYNDPIVVSETSTSFLSRLSARTGIISATGTAAGFDLPTEVMWEIAARAGSTSTYPWDDGATPSDYANFYDGSHQNTHYFREVGLKLPNNWGLYDVIANAGEWCIDGGTSSLVPLPENLKDASSPWSFVNGGGYKVYRGCVSWAAFSQNQFPVSRRVCKVGWNTASNIGFRIAWVVR